MDLPLIRAPGALLLVLCVLSSTAVGQRSPAGDDTTERVPLRAQASPTTPTSPFATDAEHVLQVYDVRDLTHGVADLLVSADAVTSAELDATARRLAQLEDQEERRAQAVVALTALEEVVRNHMEPPLHGADDDLRVLGDSVLVLRGTAAQHAWLAAFLETQRGTNALARVRTTLWIVPHGVGRGLLGTPEDMDRRLLETRTDVDDVHTAAAGLGLEVVTSPEMYAFPRQLTNVSVLNEVSFVIGWDLVRVEPDDRAVADPVIDVVQEGLTLDTRAVPLGDGFWTVDAELAYANLQRPVRSITTTLGDDGPEVEFSLPVVSRVSLSTSLTIASGGGALLLSYDRIDDRDILVLIQVEEVDPDALIQGADR